MTKTKSGALGWIICGLAAVFYCYEYVLRITPSMMVNELMYAFQADATEMGILSAFFYFIYTPMQIIVGPLSDLYGPRKILTMAIIACTIGSYIFSVSHDLLVAALGRSLIGFGSSFAFVCVLKLADIWLPKKFFGLFVGLATALGMIGAIFQITVFSSVVSSIGWQNIINMGTVVGCILIPLIFIVIRDRPLVDGGRGRPSYKKTVLGLLMILKKRQMWLNGAIACIMYLSLSLFAELWGIPFLANVYQLPTHAAASYCSMIYLGWLIGGPLIGYISDMTRSRKIPLCVGCAISIVLTMIILYFPVRNVVLLNWLLFFLGIFTSAEVLCFAISSESNPKQLVATASAFTNFLTMLGGFAAQPLVGKVLDALWSGEVSNNIRLYSSANYRAALLILPFALIVGFIFTLFLKETRK